MTVAPDIKLGITRPGDSSGLAVSLTATPDSDPINLRREYGAKAGSANSSATTQAILDAMVEAAEIGRPIKLPASDDPTSAYYFEAPLLIPDGSPLAIPGITFLGDGEDVTKLRFVYDGETQGCIRPKNPAGFTDSATFRNMAIQGDPNNTARMPHGAFLQSCRRWKFEAVQFQYFAHHQCWLYGQRYLDGTIDSTTVAKSTLAAPIGTTDATVTLVDASQYQTSGYLELDAEVIRYTGKSGNQLTGLTRGANGSTKASHVVGTQAFSCPGDSTYNYLYEDTSFFGGDVAALRFGGTTGASHISGGQSNMNYVGGGRCSGAAVGLWFDQGADNLVERHSLVANSSHGGQADWFRNHMFDVTLENNGGWGFYCRSDVYQEAHHNRAWITDGGSNVLGLVSDPQSLNEIHPYRGGFAFPRNVSPFSPQPLNNSLYNSADGILRWRDNAGLDHDIGQADLSLSAYKVITDRVGQITALAAGTYVMLVGSVVLATGSAGGAPFYFDPTWINAGSRTSKLRLALQAFANDVPSGSTFTAGFYPVTAVSGAAASIAVTLGAVVAGSTVALSPGADGLLHGESADFTAPAAGFYAIGLVIAPSMAASSTVVLRSALQARQV